MQPSGSRIWCSKCGTVKPKLGSRVVDSKTGKGRICYERQHRGRK